MAKYIKLIDNETDQNRFMELYNLYYRLLLYIAFEYLHDMGKAEDATQEAFLSIAKNIKKINGTGNKSKNLCVIILKNKCIDILRKEKTLIENIDDYDFADPNPDQLDLLLQKESVEELMGALDKISERRKMLLQLKYFHDYSQKEIAELLGISTKTVNTELFRAKKNLQQILKGDL